MDRPDRRLSRSQSQVRLKEPEIEEDSDGSLVDGWYVHRRDGRVDFVPDKSSNKRYTARHRDLEQKTAPRDKEFRARRDGYESEEGEVHRQRAPLADRRPRRDGPGDERPLRRDRQEYDLPPDNKSRRRQGESSGITDPGAGVGAAAGAAVATGAAKKLGQNRSLPRRDYDSGYSRDRVRNARDDNPSRRQRRSSSVPPPRPPPSSRDDRRRPRQRNDSYPKPRGDRDYDDRDRKRDRPRGTRDGADENDWKKKASAFLVTTAIPLIKKHGERYVKDQVEKRLK